MGGGGSAGRDSYLIIQQSEATVVLRWFTTDFVWGDAQMINLVGCVV